MPDQVEIANLPETGPRSPAASSTAPPAPGHTPRRQISLRFRLLLILGAVLLLVGAFFLWRYFSAYEDTDDAQVDAHIHPISARISGYVTDVPVNDNQFVRRGDVLVRIDPRDYQVAVDKARADLANAEAKALTAGINVPLTRVNTSSSLETAQAGVEGAMHEIEVDSEQANAADAALRAAQADNVKAQADLQRYRQLVSQQEISEQQYDQAIASAQSSADNVDRARASAEAAHHQTAEARSRLLQAKANRTAAETAPQQVDTSRSEAAARAADVQEKRAALEQAGLNLQYATVVAPVDGVVYRKVEVGENVSPGQELASVVPLDDVYITANFKETQLEHMRVGQRAVIHVDAYGRDYYGRVESIAGASGSSFSLLPPENATGNYVKVVQRVPVKIVLDPGQNGDHLLRVGMSVEPKVYVK